MRRQRGPAASRCEAQPSFASDSVRPIARCPKRAESEPNLGCRRSDLIDNRVVRQSDCDATVISYSGGVCLVAGDVAAVSTVAGNEKMLTSRNNSAVVDGHTRSDGAATA